MRRNRRAPVLTTKLLELESKGGEVKKNVRHLKPLKRCPQTDALTFPELKLGVNERDFARRSLACQCPQIGCLTKSSDKLIKHVGHLKRTYSLTSCNLLSRNLRSLSFVTISSARE